VREPFIAGFTAHAFCADWSVEGRAQAPTLAEAKAFVLAYEEARGRSFDPAERVGCGAAFAFSCAYTARCVHAVGQDKRKLPGTFQHLVGRAGTPNLGALTAHPQPNGTPPRFCQSLTSPTAPGVTIPAC